MKFLHHYQTDETFNADYYGTAYTEPWVSLTVENSHVDYNKGNNWVKVSMGDGFGPHITDIGRTFDNSENSTYYVLDEDTQTENIYVGGPGYFAYYDYHFTTTRPACCAYFTNEGGNWRLNETGC